MLGIGIAEMGLLFAVAMIVIGPDHLSEWARTWGATCFRIRREIDAVRQEINRMIGAPGLPPEPAVKFPQASRMAPRE